MSRRAILLIALSAAFLSLKAESCQAQTEPGWYYKISFTKSSQPLKYITRGPFRYKSEAEKALDNELKDKKERGAKVVEAPYKVTTAPSYFVIYKERVKDKWITRGQVGPMRDLNKAVSMQKDWESSGKNRKATIKTVQ
ncbi:MAG: hypothetical protein IT428_11210 [Planctomycetaceae bacterium]|nr:hypothetical protein [Planctomycetaceae bacterium]